MSIKTITGAVLMVCLWCLTSRGADVVPATRVKALDGSTISFPDRESRKPLLVIVGFSHKSSKDFDSWNGRFRPARMADRTNYYQLVDFQGVPSIVMRMILHGMRRATPKEERSRFASFYTGEEEWKRVTGYANPDEAYLVLAKPNGTVLWKTHGAASEQKYAELRTHLAALMPTTQ